MADRLTSDQVDKFSRLSMRPPVTRTLTIDNDAISLIDITSYVKRWGSLHTELYNKHPNSRGNFRFPVITATLDNSKSFFSMGGTIFPNGRSDFASTVAVMTIVIGGTTFIKMTGAVLEPELDPSGRFDLIIEHPLTAMSTRKWIREDRIGGDTGIDGVFDT